MAQRYKIFVNNIPLILTDNAEEIDTDVSPDISTREHILVKWDRTRKSIEELLRLLEQSGDIEQAVVYSQDYPALERAFHQCVEYVQAAGGLVRNRQQETLMIYRWGRWDLPKGGVKEGEKIKDTAVREVKEETGLRKVTIHDPLPSTFHTFIIEGNRLLKETFWFVMESPRQEEFTPAKEEDITDVRWVPPEDLPKALHSSYLSIEELVSHYLDTIKNS